MSKDIYVFAEQRDGNIQKVALELIGKGRELADTLNQKVIAVLLGNEIKEKAKDLVKAGADGVIVIEHAMLAEYTTEPYAKAVATVIREKEPEIFLFGATAIGRDLAPRVSARIHTGLTADCTGLAIDEESKNLLMTRPAFGGNIMATIVCEEHRPQMATVRPGVMKALDADMQRQGKIESMSIGFSEADQTVELLEVLKEERQIADITEAKILVSGGRGMGNAENFYELLKPLAEVFDGAISASRSAVDSGWIDHECQVGQTGKTVRPDLYLACGISGAIQHVAGMEGAEYIVAINKNETAPIFDVADLGIVGNVNTILPKLVAAIRQYKEEAGC
ncbi:electron transfer flavoprotein subunit alpha/FixB family protein [Frisingicoccus sp.]|uniref:electron transfer flavoprotein subunit alpha/FixB family protein n=1 Tax=Frisingicoccus sp. TaxID=1918627 RepID=UPI003AB7068F